MEILLTPFQRACFPIMLVPGVYHQDQLCKNNRTFFSHHFREGVILKDLKARSLMRVGCQSYRPHSEKLAQLPPTFWKFGRKPSQYNPNGGEVMPTALLCGL